MTSNIPINRVKLVLINDNINVDKNKLIKYDPIDEGETHPLSQENLDLVHSLNLMNISVVSTRWSTSVESSKAAIKELY